MSRRRLFSFGESVIALHDDHGVSIGPEGVYSTPLEPGDADLFAEDLKRFAIDEDPQE